jgi:DNA-binding transcriptional regulator LsrR (DeoR family)
MAHPPNGDQAFVTEVCWRYFVNGFTQAEVARAMGVTRLRVYQAIGAGRASGLVQVSIQSPFVMCLEQQEALQTRYAMPRAIVVPVGPVDVGAHDYHGPVGAALAHYVTEAVTRENWQKLGVSWGVALEQAIARLPQMDNPDMQILSLMGGISRGSRFNAFSIASGLADRFGAQHSHLVAPVYLPVGIDPDAYLNTPLFRDHLRVCAGCDVALLVAGDVSDLSYMVRYGLPQDVTTQSLCQAGAVGDILGRFLDPAGQEVDHPINTRVAGLSLTKLAAIPHKVLTAAGRHKVPIIRAAMARGLVDVLITDDVTAALLLAPEMAPA